MMQSFLSLEILFIHWSHPADYVLHLAVPLPRAVNFQIDLRM